MQIFSLIWEMITTIFGFFGDIVNITFRGLQWGFQGLADLTGTIAGIFDFNGGE